MVVSESVNIVLETFRAIEERDIFWLLELCHPDVEFHWPPSLPYGGSFRGDSQTSQPSWAEVWHPLQQTEDERRIDPRVIAATEDEVVVLWHQRGLSPSGERFDGKVLALCGVRDSKFSSVEMFYFDTAAVLRFLDDAHASEPKAGT
jgi:ketosteroid isomerase-like protein